ncbi:GNAT family N-acetyltransferase [Mycobacterium sp. Y57]|uniref:N-acetylglutamate synthase, CG3035 family n=1 Tax=Mycolicibacterium xanthum TaxID=2796469 RepID=UPI001C8501EA|nr:GNAT family N-acetyltransferase [Mycolicibacterium xanthum]MBX7435566.1 GNAT family N-acetyltransferase [Mycolicibacterium xanthum]
MTGLPEVGTRVSLRYRLPRGSTPPHSDVVGHLLDTGPTVRIRTRRGDVVAVAAADVLAVRVVPEVPVRTGEIRNLEHAAALGWPGTEHEWLDGWLLRFGHGATRRANSAVPLHFTSYAEIVAVADWYAARGAVPLVSVPDRLLRLPDGVHTDAENLVMAADMDALADVADAHTGMHVASRPDAEWLRLYQRDVPVDVLTAVVDGEVGFGRLDGAAVGRVAITEAPDGTRWAGVSAVHVSGDARRRGLARALCAGLIDWAEQRGAGRCYVQVVTDNPGARALYESMGFWVHHRSRYVRADELLAQK